MPLNSKTISMRGVRTFCVAARHCSFRLAAEELFVTASAVSHQVKRLEEELQVSLFDRQGRSITLTPAGQVLYEEASQAVARLDEVAEQLRSGYRRATLRVSVQPFVASELFVPRLHEFTDAHPGIDIHVDTSDESAEKHPPDADVSIRMFRKPPKSLSSQLMFRCRLVPACSPEYREHLGIVGWRLNKPLTIVLHSSRPNAWKTWCEHSGIAAPEASNIVRLDSMIAVARATERGLGAALIPLPMAGEWFRKGTLVRLFDYELFTPESCYFVCSRDVQHRPDISALRDWSITSFARQR